MKNKIILLFSACCSLLAPAYAIETLNVQGVTYKVDTLDNIKIGPGSYYTALDLTRTGAKLKVFFLEVDAKNPYIRFNSLLGRDSIVMGERISLSAARNSKPGEVYFAGTNGDFYETSGSYVGRTINGSIVRGEIARAPHSSRPMFGIDETNNPFLGVMSFSGSVKAGEESFTISNVNDVRNENKLILYNINNGSYTHTNSYGTEVLVELEENSHWGVNRTHSARVVRVVKGVGNMRMEKGQAVLSGHGTAQAFLDKLTEGEALELTLNYSLPATGDKPALYGAVGGDRLILKDGEVTNNDWAELHPRTAIGYSANGDKIIFCVVDGRSMISVGTTTKQLADIIKSAGAADAVNLDGGGSSGMYIKEFGMMNNGSDGNERAVANGIFAVCTAPEDDRVSEILPKRRKYRVPVYGVVTPTILGYNQYGVLVEKEVKATYSCDPEMGYINETGSFVASGSKGGELKAVMDGVETSLDIELVQEAPISLRLDSVLIDNLKQYAIEVEGTIDGEKMTVLPSALKWTVEDPRICHVEEGVLSGLENGETRLFGELGQYKDTLRVKVQIPNLKKLPAADFSDMSDWKVTASSNLKNFALNYGNADDLFLNYTYSSGRAPSIQLVKSQHFYGLPDSIKLVVDPKGAVLSKVVMSLRTNNQSTQTPFIVDNPASDKEMVIGLSMDDLTDNPDDISMYPIRFDYVNFYLASSGNVANQEYSIHLKELSLIYDNVALGFTSPLKISTVKAFPNPVTNGELQIAMNDDYAGEFSVTMVTQEGRMILKEKFEGTSATLSLKGLLPGLYLLNVVKGAESESLKVYIK